MGGNPRNQIDAHPNGAKARDESSTTERNQTPATGLRPIQMATTESVPAIPGEMVRVRDENGTVAQLAQNYRGQLWHGRRCLLHVFALAHSTQPKHIHTIFTVCCATANIFK